MHFYLVDLRAYINGKMFKTISAKKGITFFYIFDTQGGIKSVCFVTAFLEGQS